MGMPVRRSATPLAACSIAPSASTSAAGSRRAGRDELVKQPLQVL